MSDENLGPSDSRPRLGRGLASLLGASSETVEASGSDTLKRVPVEFLRPNPRNPRRDFDEAALSDLADSIKERGIIQPILVRPVPALRDAYEIVAGERRWRAAQLAGLIDLPVVLVHVDDKQALELAIIENIQRSDLNALEEAAGFAQLGSMYSYSHAEIARVVGKSRSHVANTLRLTNLPEHTRDLLASGQISAGHARALLAVSDPNRVADLIVERGLTVRDVERLNSQPGPKAPSRRRVVESSQDPDTVALQGSLELSLGTKVRIRHKQGSGELCISFLDFEQLNSLCARLT